MNPDIVEVVARAIAAVPTWDGDTLAHDLTREELYAAAQAALTAARPAIMAWQPIETAPTKTDEFGLSEYVLLYLPDHDGGPWVTMGTYFREEERAENGRFKGGEWTGVDWDGLPSGYLSPTHWQPLPAPPVTP